MKNLLYILFLIFSITFGYAQEIVTQDLQSANVNYTIKGIKYDEKTKRIIIIGDAGAGNESDRGSGEDSQEVLPGGKDYTFIDKDGKVWAVSEEGNVTQAGKMAQGGASTPQNTAGVDAKGNATTITAEGIRVTFKNSSDSKYAFDQPAKALNSDYKKLNGKVIPFKAVENKKTEPFIASVEITDNSISADSLIFKTSKGVPIDAKKVGNDYRLTLKGLYSYATEQVQAIIKQGDKYQVAGAFNLVHISPKTIKLNLVPTTGVSISRNQIQKVKDIYKKIAIDVDISVKEAFDITPYLVNGKLPSEDVFGDLSSYSPAQNKVIEAYKQQRGVDLAYYIFVTDRPSSNGQAGYMRLGGQFGFVYDQQARTIAHELGHGALRLEHPFKEFKNVAQGEVKNLMDYNTTNTNFIYPDWKQVNDPKFKIYAFQGQEQGEFDEIHLTPNWEPFKFSGSNIYISGSIKKPNGAVHGIYVCKNENDCSEYYWKSNGGTPGYYTDGISKPLSIIYLSQSEKNKNPSITLFWNYGKCGYNKTYSTTWDYIKDKKGFDIANVKDAGKIVYKEKIPCIANNSVNTQNLEDTCVGKDVSQINKGHNRILENSKNSDLIVETINSVDICSLKNLTYEEIEKLLKILADNDSIKEAKEKALLRIISQIKVEDLGKFINFLQEEKGVFNNLINGLDDHSIFFWDGNNYTGFINLLLKMYKKMEENTSFNEKIFREIGNTSNEQIFSRILLLEPKEGKFQQHLFFSDYVSYYQRGEYDSTSNTVIIYNREKRISYTYTNYGTASTVSGRDVEKIGEVSPLAPVLVYIPDNQIDIVQESLVGVGDTANYYIVPAIFLHYYSEKKFQDLLQKGIITTLDVATIALSGGTALATKVHWVRRAWALAEVVGAAGNIAVNTEIIDVNSNYGKAIKVYNDAMSIIGLKNLAKGGYNFAKKLPNLLQKSDKVNLLSAKYLEWNSLITKYKSPESYINSEVRKAIEEQGTILGQLSDKVLREFNTPAEISRFLKTDKNGAFFWSGRTSKGDGVMDMALEIAQSKGGNTLEGLLAKYNIDMPIWDASNPVTVKIWEDVSALYATQVSGEVRAVLGKNLRPGNIWETVELPRLKQNPNVTKITTIDPETMKETIIFKK
ncbi:hypothetical protein [Riemerella columbina]|uniref:hypothetical protein n=1 Tax=Riemerella columbina TaxID=103810 RepID=UPI00266F642C|nr:hypothetical protein [Riemerella columbina]WKS95937.1 hypothetical protein NYR17_04170 [Riemerella columbina]